MNKMNYQRELDRVIAQHQRAGEVPKLLLHVCCAPCSSYCLEYLSDYFDITVYYYNPNISIKEEYAYRLREEKRFLSLKEFRHPVRLTESAYHPEEFFAAVKGLEQEPEGTISPLKNAALLNEIGAEMGAAYGVPWLWSDFKKREGYKRSIELSREFDLYRQNYCGCVFSRRSGDRK